MKGFFYTACLILLSLSVDAKQFLPSKFRIEFVKELKSILKKKKMSKGVISYQYPGKIRIEQSEPFHTMYISNGEQAWLYSAPFDSEKEKGEVTLLNPRQMQLAKVFEQLRRGLKSNSVYEVTKKDRLFTLNFNEKSKQKYRVDFVQIQMGSARATRFDQVEVLTIKTQNATEKYKIAEVDLAPSFPSAHFNFRVTKGMKVMKP